MADSFGLKIGLEGEKEFKSALSEINQSFKVLGSEMKLVQSQFDKNDNSVEALTARNQVLNKEIEAQRQKIDPLRAALDNAAESFGENDRRTQNWQIQLNNAEAALNSMERELSGNEQAIQGMTDEMDAAGDSTENFSDAVEDSGDAAEDAGGKFEKFKSVLGTIAKATAGFTGADLENLVNEGALLAARKDRDYITMEDFRQAEIKVIAGPEKRSRVISPHERELTAWHEAGHAVVMETLPEHDPVNQITIVPRGQAGGMTIALPEEDRSFLSKRYLEDRIVALLGGRMAEKLCLGDISTGAGSDIQRATDIARKMVAVYGMSETIGSVCFEGGHDEVFIGRTMSQGRSYSEAVAAQIDEEVRRVVDEAGRRCEDILTEKRAILDAVAAYLLEHETMERDAFLEVYGGKPPAEEQAE